MHLNYKKILTALLHAATACVNRSRALQYLLRHFPGNRKMSIVKRLTTYPKQISARCFGVRYHLHLTDLLQREIYFNCYDKKQLRQMMAYQQFPLEKS